MDVNAAVAAAAAIAGVCTGVIAMLAFRWSERDQKRPTRTSLHTDPVLPPGVDTVLSVLRSSAVVLDEADSVVKASSAAYALGLVRGGKLAVEPMLQMARDTRRDGEIRQVELDLPRRGTGRGDALAVSARVAPLGSRLVLLLVEDLTEARRIEAVRRDFVANVSHELKTPVGALSLLSEAVMDASDDPEAVERFAGRMQNEATRLTSLVQELIDLSRVQNDDPLEDSEPVRVDELVAEAIDRCRQPAASKQITMAAGGTADLRVWGNRGQLAAALGNLVENAVNYSCGPYPRGHSRPPRLGRRRRPHRDSRHRPGHRHLREGQGACLRALLPRRPGPLPRDRRHGPRPRHRQARGGLARRGGDRVELRGTGLHLHPAAARSGRDPHRTFPQDIPHQWPRRRTRRRRRTRARRHNRIRIHSCHSCRPGGPSVTRVLVVEDEESFSDALSYMLRKEGFEVAIAATGPDGLDEFERNGADLVLLDLMLPGLPGTEVCRQLRGRSNVPVIMVTAKDSEIDKVVGLEIGADDYVTKPFSSRELVARIRAVLRRHGEPEEVAPQALEAGPVRMDVDRHVVTVGGGKVDLPLKEFDLLEMLLRNAGRVLTRMQLIDRVWGADYVGDTKTLDVHVKRLRAKIEPDPGAPRFLVTVRGLGYKFEP